MVITTAAGATCSKEGVTASWRTLAEATGARGRFTGHLGRVMCAQMLARTGMELWRIQGFCRWGSNAVLGYVRDALLETSVEYSADVVKNQLNLKEVQEELVHVGASKFGALTWRRRGG